MRERKIFFAFLLMFQIFQFQLIAQCPTIAITNGQTDIILNDFSELINGVTVNAAAYVEITAPAGCFWDLFVTTPTPIPIVPYSLTAGIVMPLDRVNIRARNGCSTPDHDYGLGTPPPPPRISGTFDNPLTGVVDNYIVGTATNPEFPAPPIVKNNGACLGTNIDAAGNPTANSTTHRFQIDLQVIPGVVPVIRPGLYTLALTFHVVEDANGTENTVILNFQIEILPVLQLKMSTPTQIDFTFSDVKQYNAGIIKYGATILEVNSSLDWDLMAIGTSSNNEGGFGAIWDNPADYSTGGSSSPLIPLRVLELRQTPANPSGSAIGEDYSQPFSNPPSGNNYIEIAISPYNALGFFVPPSIGGKTIAGNWLSTVGPAPADEIGPGSYNVINVAWNRADFRYVIDYRLTPELPADFGGLMPVGTYAQPGSYTMEVKYILSEDQ